MRLRRRNPQGPKPLVWTGYRNCNRCTRWRPVSDYPVYLTRTGYEQIKGECEHCKQTRENERYAKLTPEQKRAKGIKANKQASKRRNQALSYIEHQRKILDRQNEKITKLEARVDKSRTRVLHEENQRDPYVDIVPFRMWLLRRHREGGYNINQLAEEIGQDASRVGRWLRGFEWNGAGNDPMPLRSIKLSTVDKIAVALNDPGLVSRMYPMLVDD